MQARRPNPKGCHAFGWYDKDSVRDFWGQMHSSSTYWELPEFTIQHPLWFKLARLWDRRKLGWTEKEKRGTYIISPNCRITVGRGNVEHDMVVWGESVFAVSNGSRL